MEKDKDSKNTVTQDKNPQTFETPSYIRSLLMPQAKGQKSRRAWSIDLETVWLPFFTATNTMGETSIPYDALGSPIRLAYDKDGSVKFSNTGRPVTKIVKSISENINLIRQNFVANLQQYTANVATEMEAGYTQTIELAVKAGKPIIKRDNELLQKAIKARTEAELNEVAKIVNAETVPSNGNGNPEPEPEKELAKVR